ncbi:hypothetical protein KIW84_035010 [Lathyrus oleraceus]|uniref:Uncharacterized protein n=1 Tax=Pisum sativum TaxID=3888 RepID=A0A9D4Y4X6_PEA|nr:hypothetical protein KIW84_035010 [Pisum sativum]
MSSNVDGESGRRDNSEESWRNYHEDRQHVANGKMNVEQCRTENQIADIMTKGVQVEVFIRLRAMMNVDSLDIMN